MKEVWRRKLEGNKILKNTWKIFWEFERNIKEIWSNVHFLNNFIGNVAVAEAPQQK